MISFSCQCYRLNYFTEIETKVSDNFLKFMDLNLIIVSKAQFFLMFDVLGIKLSILLGFPFIVENKTTLENQELHTTGEHNCY